MERMQQMTLIHLNLAPLPKSVQRDINDFNIKPRIRTLLSEDEISAIKKFLLDGLLNGSNYASIYADLLDSSIIPEGCVIQFRFITKLLNDISSTVCRIGCYDHRVFLMCKYVDEGMSKTKVAKKLGMKREAVYMAYRKANRK